MLSSTLYWQCAEDTSHDVAPIPLCVPCPHLRQLSEAHPGAYCPGVHGVHTAMPGKRVNLPGGHAAHMDEDSSET